MIFRKIHISLERLSTKTAIAVLFLLSHIVFLLMMLFTFPRINAKFGTQAFDLKTFGYTQSEARMMLQNLDQSTIDLYLFPQLFLLDVLYPILLALFLSTLIIRLSKLINVSQNHVFSSLFMLPFITMFIDYSENILISLMITNPINVSSEIIKAANIFTLMKGGSTTLSWLIILILFGIWLINKWKNNMHTANNM